MKDSDFSGVFMYDDPMVLPTSEMFSTEAPGFPELPQASLVPSPKSAGHEMPSPFSTGLERDPGYDVMPMPAMDGGMMVPFSARAGIPPEIRPTFRSRSVGEIEEVRSGIHKHMVGLSILLAGGGAAVGYTQGGAYGALAGSLFGGAAVNVYRAFKFYMDGSEEGSKEAVVSGTYALVAAAAGGFLWYKFVHENKEQATKNPTCDKDVMGDNPCGIRRVGP